ncbi:Elongation of fatty acids protein 2 [Exophiala dermatitidis]
MEFINSTYKAAASLLPYATPVPKKHQLSMLSPKVFSMDPYSMFDRAYTALLGYRPHEFRFVQGKTPLSTFKECAIFIAAYYVIIFGGRELMRNRAPIRLNNLFIIHNFYLTVISGGLLLLFAQQLIPGLWKNGLYDGICGSTGWSQELLVLYYITYLTKYLELLDTVFLVLRKKPLTFLHTYHHGATALLCYTQLVGQTSVQWVPITLNLGVHVVMYWYYYQVARGNKCWWKQYITMFQISQFVLDLGFIYYACYNYYASTYAPWLPHRGTCGDTRQELAAFTGCVILSSYLVLFVMFYLSTYKKPQPTKKALKRTAQTEVPTISETTEMATDALKSATNVIVECMGEEKCIRS